MKVFGYGYGFVLGSISALKALVNAFKARVLADSGTFEGEANLLNQKIADINAASFVYVPSAYKANKLYALKGPDLTNARSSVAYRNNASNVLEQMAANVGRVHYIGGVPTLLVEPPRTNLFLNSFTPVTQTITVVNGTVYTVSINGGTATLSGAGSGSATTGSNRTFTASGTSLTVTISGSPTWCQVEAGALASLVIATLGSPVTKVADTNSVTRTFTQAQTIFQTIYLNAGSLSDGGVYCIFEARLSASSRITFYRFNNTIQIDVINTTTQYSGTVFTITSPIKDAVYKIAITFTPTVFKVFVNGALVYTSATLSMPNLGSATLSIGCFISGVLQYNGSLGENYIYDYAMTDGQAITRTT
jgi:hypothetical protein